ncbi:MAG: DoxX family protein [Flammeovirgaceae bacterium]|nr:DoxX family protein [Flammeovirgaceae bacterium]
MKTTNTSQNITLLATRFILAFVTAAHGVQKSFGWFGGYGFDGTMGFFTDTIGLPYILGLGIIVAETVGMIALALGLFGRFFSGFVIAIMLGAIFSFHLPNGFYMNWGGNLAGEGYEFHLLAIGLALPVLMLGSGAYSIDHLLFSRKKTEQNMVTGMAE